MKYKSRAIRMKAPNYQRTNLGVAFKPSFVKIGNPCKSAVAVGHAKIIYRDWKATCEIQKNNKTIIHSRPQIENKSKSTELKEPNYQRKNLGVAFQPSCDKICNPCKFAVAVQHAKIIYRDWKATHETQQNNGTNTPLVSHTENKL